MSTNKLPNGLQHAVNQLGSDCMDSSAAIEAIHAAHAGHVAELTRIANHVVALARIAELEVECDALRAKLAAIEAQEPVAWAPSIVSGPKARALAGMGQSLTVWFDKPETSHPGRGHCQTPLYARPVHAQAAPDADAERYRWLKTRPVEVPTDGPDLALWSDSCGDALRGDAADAAIDDAMATGLGRKA